MFISQKIKKKISNSETTKINTLKYLYHKGFFTIIRGAIRFLFVSVKFPFFCGKNVKILFQDKFVAGKNCYLGDYSYLDCLSKNGVILGDNVTIREYCWVQSTSNLSNIGEGLTIGNDTYIGPRCMIGSAAQIKIGCNVQIGAGVNIIAENHCFTRGEEIFTQGVTREGIEISDGCWLGNNSIILDGVKLGVVVAAGAVVTRDVSDYHVVAGVPAKTIKVRK